MPQKTLGWLLTIEKTMHYSGMMPGIEKEL